jgi:murein DD-endopeptidase MepM/ murein hydrolase activator NlpD
VDDRWFERAEQLLFDGRPEEARMLCEQTLAKWPRSTTLRLLLAQANAALGRDEAARAELRRCLRIDPSCTEARVRLSELAQPEPPPLPPIEPMSEPAQAWSGPVALGHDTPPAPFDVVPEPPDPLPPADAPPLLLAPRPPGRRLLVPGLALAGALGLTALMLVLVLRGRAPAPAPAVLVTRAPPPAPAPAAAPPPPPLRPEIRALLDDLWIHPLHGPKRRMPIRSTRLFGAEREGDRPRECRAGHCGVDLGGERWGEPVLAAHDGVVDRVQRGPNDEHGGMYVRLSHRDRAVFTQYFHLAAIPRQLAPGVRVKAGDTIGLLGDSGVHESGPHLHFTVSVSNGRRDERYVDPEPLIALWPLSVLGGDGDETSLTAEAPVGFVHGISSKAHRRRNQRAR